MIPRLEANEVRVLGALMEKAVITPDVYPLTINALTNACNQKSSRDPVTSLSAAEVTGAARDLEAKTLVRREENFRTGMEKYQQRFCNTPFSTVKLDAQEYGLLCLLLLRGGPAARAGWAGVLVFHVLLMSFGFGFWLWSIPVLAQDGGGAAWVDGSQPPPVVREAIDARIAGTVLDPVAERAAQQRGWTR